MQKRFSKGLMFTSTWTWAKEISDTDDTDDFELNNTIENTYNRRRDRGNVYSVPRHQWMNQALYELPLGKGKLLGGWQLNALLNLSTGNWFTPLISGPDPTNTNQTTLRPDCQRRRSRCRRPSINGSIRRRSRTPANGSFGQCRPRHHRRSGLRAVQSGPAEDRPPGEDSARSSWWRRSPTS